MADERISPTEAAHADVHHEQSDVNVGAVLWSAVILVIFAIVVHVAIYGHVMVLRKMERDPDLLPVSMVKKDGPTVPPAPRLQPFPTPDAKGKGASPLMHVPPRDMTEMRAEQERFLSSYGWANEATKTAHIPIERAIDLQLQRGYPVAAPGTQPQPGVPVPDMAQPAGAPTPAQPARTTTQSPPEQHVP